MNRHEGCFHGLIGCVQKPCVMTDCCRNKVAFSLSLCLSLSLSFVPSCVRSDRGDRVANTSHPRPCLCLCNSLTQSGCSHVDTALRHQGRCLCPNAVTVCRHSSPCIPRHCMSWPRSGLGGLWHAFTCILTPATASVINRPPRRKRKRKRRPWGPNLPVPTRAPVTMSRRAPSLS